MVPAIVGPNKNMVNHQMQMTLSAICRQGQTYLLGRIASIRSLTGCHAYEHPDVSPHVSHLRQTPFLTIV